MILEFLFFLAFQHIAGPGSDSDFELGFDSDSGSGSDFGFDRIVVVDSASSVESVVVATYVVMEAVLVLVVVHVPVDRVMIQVFLGQVVLVHAVLALALVLVPVLDQGASASAPDHAQAISKQSSYFADSLLLDFPLMKRPL